MLFVIFLFERDRFLGFLNVLYVPTHSHDAREECARDSAGAGQVAVRTAGDRAAHQAGLERADSADTGRGRVRRRRDMARVGVGGRGKLLGGYAKDPYMPALVAEAAGRWSCASDDRRRHHAAGADSGKKRQG